MQQHSFPNQGPPPASQMLARPQWDNLHVKDGKREASVTLSYTPAALSSHGLVEKQDLRTALLMKPNLSTPIYASNTAHSWGSSCCWPKLFSVLTGSVSIPCCPLHLSVPWEDLTSLAEGRGQLATPQCHTHHLSISFIWVSFFAISGWSGPCLCPQWSTPRK